MEKNLQKNKYMCVCIIKSLCCTPKTTHYKTTTLQLKKINKPGQYVLFKECKNTSIPEICI